MIVLLVRLTGWVGFHSFNPMLARLGLRGLIWGKPLKSVTLRQGVRQIGPFLQGKYAGILLMKLVSFYLLDSNYLVISIL